MLFCRFTLGDPAGRSWTNRGPVSGDRAELGDFPSTLVRLRLWLPYLPRSRVLRNLSGGAMREEPWPDAVGLAMVGTSSGRSG